MTDIPISTISRIESGEIASFEKHRLKLAAALGCSPDDLDADDYDVATVPVVGIVKWKCFVKDLPEKDREAVPLIAGLPPTSKAIRIRGTHLVPYFGNGELLYYDGIPQTNDRLFLDRRCLVEQDTKRRGEKLICWVTPGSKPGHYILHPYGGAVIMDAKLKAVHPILQTISS